MDRARFEQFVAQAVEALPPKFQAKIKNVAFVVRDEPTKRQLEENPGDPARTTDGVQSGEGDLLGLYEGVPLIEREGVDTLLPDKISIFQKPIERMAAADGVPVADVVRDTVWHEVGHYVGFDDEQIERLEKKWRR